MGTKKKASDLRLVKFFIVAIVFVSAWFFIDTNPKWIQPERLKSKDGVLEVTLDAAKSKVSIGGKETESNVWNGKYLGSAWEVKGGDKILIHYRNNMQEPTNLHFHGSHVSPKGNSDNVLLSINPGETFEYEYQLPVTHPPGLYWYHPHLHGYTDDQVAGGLAGAVMVRGDVDELPGIKGLPERLLVLTTQDPSNSDEVIRLVNNMVKPTLYVRPFETTRLEILNASADDFYYLSIPGQKLNIISRDGNTLSQVDSVEAEVMAPGDRIQVIFQPGWKGEYEVKSLKFNAGSFTYVEDAFMKIKVAGLPVIPRKLPTKLLPFKDFRDVKVDRVRTLTFSEGGTNDNPTFLIDGKEFNPNIINQIMTLGTVEEWRLVNTSDDIHPFHIHINPFQVISANGVPIERYGYDDTYPIPANGELVIRTQYNDFDGKYVLHCHILFHEDHGMMQLVEVVKPGNKTSPDNGMPEREGMPGMKMGRDR